MRSHEHRATLAERTDRGVDKPDKERHGALGRSGDLGRTLIQAPALLGGRARREGHLLVEAPSGETAASVNRSSRSRRSMGLPRARHHPPAHRDPRPHHHRQDRTVPQDPANRAADRPPLRLAPPRPTSPGRLGGRLQRPPPPQGHRHAGPGPTLPARYRGPAVPARHRGPHRDHPTGVGQRPVSAGRHLAGQVVTVRLHPTVLQGHVVARPGA